MSKSVTLVYNRRNKLSKQGLSAIEFIVYLHGKQHILASGVKIPPKAWSKRHRAVSEKHPGSSEMNKELTEKHQKIKEALYRDNITIEQIKQIIAGNNEESLTFNQFWWQEIRNESVKFNTIRIYTLAARVLDEVSPNTRFEDIGYNLANKYKKYLIEERQVAPSTLTTRIKNLRKFVKIALIKEHITYHQYMMVKEVKAPSVGGNEKIYLTVDELRKIYAKDLSKYPHLERERDRFIVGAFTALRYSDFSMLQKENFKQKEGRWYCYDNAQKTNDPLVIPVHPIVLDILKKYNFFLPAPISNQKANSYIKDICAMAEINDSEIKIERKGNNRVEYVVPKYKLITTHTARRSAATNMYLAGINSRDVMRITGHKTETAFKEYICATSEQVAHKMASHDFFN